MTATRRLILLRHAKSDWPDVPDRDRPLAKRGRRDAPKIGRWLRDRAYLPEIVICSDARRTRQTWDRVARELGGSPSVTFEPRAYAASAMTLLYLVMELPATSRRPCWSGTTRACRSWPPAWPCRRTATTRRSGSPPPPWPSWTSPATGPT